MSITSSGVCVGSDAPTSRSDPAGPARTALANTSNPPRAAQLSAPRALTKPAVFASSASTVALPPAGSTSLLSTAGGLVFGGTEEGNFFALDAANGKLLWETQLGGAVRGIPISFAVDGRQFIAISAGFAVFVFAL